MIIHLGPLLPGGSSGYLRSAQRETAGKWLKAAFPTSVYLASGGVYPASDVTVAPVSSYLTFSPLPGTSCETPGGLFSVALSLRLPSGRRYRPPFSVMPGLSSRSAKPSQRSSHRTDSGTG